MKDKDSSGRLGLGLKPETETWLGFSIMMMVVPVSSYVACEVFPDHKRMFLGIACWGVSLLLRAYRIETKKQKLNKKKSSTVLERITS